MYGEVFVSTISLVFLLLMAFLKLVAKIVKLYVSGMPSRLRMHADCSAYEPRPHLFVDGYNYLASAEWRSYTGLPFFEDSRQMPGVCSP